MKKIFNLLLIVSVLVMSAGCRTLKPPVTTTAGVSLQEICKHYNIQWQFDSVTQVVFLDYKNHKAKALIGSPVILIGSEKITLSGALRRVKSTIYVPDDFESKVIGSIGATSSRGGVGGEVSNSKIHTIVIDPGHGGKDPGAKGYGGVKEKEVVLDIAMRLKHLLDAAGFKIIMTRSSDTYPTLEERTELATRNEVDLFVSIHANSNPARRMEGIEVYYVKTHEKSDLDEDQRQKNEKTYFRSLHATPGKGVGAIVADMMYQLKISESSKLAMRIVHNASADVEMPNRGARHARYFVVRNTLIPAVLIETGFLTNKQEEKKLNSSDYRQKLAESIARSILAYASSS